SFAQQSGNLFCCQSEIEDGQSGVEVLVKVFGDAIFLDAKADVFAVDLQVRFNDPLVSIVALTLEEKGMRPGTPAFLFVQVTLGSGNGFVDEGDAARKSDAADAGVTYFLAASPS